jgi:hypothetical protein
VGLWRVDAVATRRGAGRPATARKTSIFSVKKKHKSINTKKNRQERSLCALFSYAYVGLYLVAQEQDEA